MNPLEYSRSYYSGWPKDVIPLLKISVGIFLTRYKLVKVGITCNPEQRWGEHIRQDRENWSRMIVKYKTTSKKNANDVEDFFINNEPRLTNCWTGWSNMNDSGEYYVYILLGKPYRK